MRGSDREKSRRERSSGSDQSNALQGGNAMLPKSESSSSAASSSDNGGKRRRMNTVRLAAEAAMTHQRVTQTSRKICMIDPRKKPITMGAWDGITAVSLIFVALVTPFEVGFLDPAESPLDPLWLVNRVIDVIFASDLFMQFFMMVEVRINDESTWISDRKQIAYHYLLSWFIVDASSVAVSSFDYLFLFGDSDNDVNSNLRLFRVLRALRLIKLVKLLRGMKIIQRYEVLVAINYAALSLSKCIIGMLLLSHWMACVWGLQTGFATSKLDTWLGKGEVYCWADDNVTGGVDCLAPHVQWVAAIYWAVMTITSIGYGDISAIPGNTNEQIVCTLLMVTGSMSWGLVLGTIVANLSNLDPEGDEFTNTMSELNKMMRREGLPNEMRIRLRMYFHQTHHMRQAKKRAELLELMSPTLKSEVAWEVNKEWLGRIYFLEGASLAFLVQLSLTLEASVFAPGEIAPIGPLYIVNRGLALYGGRCISRGLCWGEDVILTSEHLQIKYCALAMNYLEVFALHRHSLEEVAQTFPEVWKKLRFFAIRLAVRRAFVLEAWNRRFAMEATERGEGRRNSLLQQPEDNIGIDMSASTDDMNAACADARRAYGGARVRSRQTAEEAAAATLGAAKACTKSYKGSAPPTTIQRRHNPAPAASTAVVQPKAVRAATPAFSTASDSISPADTASDSGQWEAQSPLQRVIAHAMPFVFNSAVAATGIPDTALESAMEPQVLDAATVREEIQPILAALLHEIRPTIEALGASQASMRAALSAHRQEMRAVAEDVKALRSWVVTDVLAKLKV